jgi:hypothetical protein
MQTMPMDGDRLILKSVNEGYDESIARASFNRWARE